MSRIFREKCHVKKAKKQTRRDQRDTPSFSVELPLRTRPRDDHWLRDRVVCGQRLFNVLLQDGFARVAAMRADPAWVQARTTPTPAKKQAAYDAVKAQYGFTSVAFDALVKDHAHAAKFSGRIGSHEMQRIATQVFTALADWVYGKHGRPRFKGRQRPLHSLQGKNNTGMLQWKPELHVLQVEQGWHIPVALPDLGKDEWLWTALQARTKYCQVIWRYIRGERRWFVHLIQEGLSPLKASLLEKLASPDARGGFDLGPSNFAWCTTTDAGIIRLCAEIDRPHALLRRLQRHLDRQRRAANPDNYQPEGTMRKGKKTWTVSNRQRHVEATVQNLSRVEAAVRRSAHGRTVNRLLTKARHWQDDGVSSLALQRSYGTSVNLRAPGLLVSELIRKAERAGGSRTIIESRTLKTSQYDHTTDDCVNKRLSDRWHVFRDGRGMVQRDLYSAFLALHVEGNTHHPARLETAWQAMTSRLRAAGWYVPQGTMDPSGATDPTSRIGRVPRPSIPILLV
jgi:hypothetical protein